MKKQNSKNIFSFVCFLIISVIVIGCSSMPISITETENVDLFSCLNNQEDMYAYIPVSNNKVLLETVMTKMIPDIKEDVINNLLDRTQSLYLGIKSTSGLLNIEELNYELISTGNYPKNMIGSFLNKKNGWSKISETTADNKTFKYHQHKDGIHLAIPTNNLLFASSQTLLPLLQSVPLEESNWDSSIRDIFFAENLSQDSVKIYVRNISDILPKIIGPGLELAINKAIIILTPYKTEKEMDMYQLDIHLGFSDSRAIKPTLKLLQLTTNQESNTEFSQNYEDFLTIHKKEVSITSILNLLNE